MIKRVISFAVDKAILNHVLFILMLTMALFAYKAIPKEIFPPSNLDAISISGGYPGASADILDKMAVRGIEDDLKSVDNVGDITSIIKNGMFNITLDIKEGANLQLVLNDVKDVVANSKRDLPSDMNEPTARTLIYQFPLLLIAISGDVSKDRLLEVSKKLKSKLTTFKDLGNIDIRGDADYEMKVELYNQKIEALDLNRQLLYKSISSLSSIFPAGTIKNRGEKIYISSVNGEKDVKILKNTILSVGNKKVRLKDIAKITYALNTPNTISSFNGKENISLNVTKLKSGNAIKLSKQVKAMLKNFAKDYKDINFEVYTDTSLWIRNRLNLVTSNIMFGLFLVFLSILLSVNWKISLVVALGIPTSFFIAIIAANQLGYSINMLSMLGALLALGMLVDEAIVVAENIYRHLEMGKTPRDAAIDGATEMFPAVLTATATTVFAFLPLLIMSGELGMFMKILPVMITILLLSSLFEAFYFLPLHAKEFFSIGKVKKEHKTSGFWNKLHNIYNRLIYKLLDWKELSTLLLVTLIIGSTITIAKFTKFEMFPKFDAEQIYISGKVDVNNKLMETKKLIEPIEKLLLKDINQSNIGSITSMAGIKFLPDQSAQSGEHLFHIFVNLKEHKPSNFFDKYINPYLSIEYDNSNMTRDKDAFTLLKEIQKKLKKIEAIKDKNGKPIYSDISIFVPQTGIIANDVEIEVIERDNQDINKAINSIMKSLKGIDGIKDIMSNKQNGPQELKLKLNKYGQDLGFSESYIISTLRGMFLEAEYGKMLGSVGVIRVTLQNANKDNNYDLKSMYIYTPDGKGKVALKDIVDFIYVESPLVVHKDDGKKVWSITAQTIKGKTTATEVMQKIQPTIDKLKKEGYEFIIKGEDEAKKQVIIEMVQAAIIAIFLIFISLILMFNSLVLPLITLSVIPLSVLGAFVGTKLMGINMTLPGIMGIVGLAGVVVNDAIIMLDFIRGSKTISDVSRKSITRLRPIMLTSVTTVLGLSSLIFFASGQALIIQPMAISLGFGVAWATILNLIYIPLMYSIVYRVKER